MLVNQLVPTVPLIVKQLVYHHHPCSFPGFQIGQYRFLDLSISFHPSYSRILSLPKVPQSQYTLLDLGYCFAQDIRKLVYDGVPSQDLYICGLEAGFLELGYDPSKDKETWKTHGFAADVFAQSSALDEVDGRIDAIYAASFFGTYTFRAHRLRCRHETRLRSKTNVILLLSAVLRL